MNDWDWGDLARVEATDAAEAPGRRTTNGEEKDILNALGRRINSFSIFPCNSKMGCAACGSGKVKRKDPRGKAYRERLEQSLTAVFQAYERRDIYFIADRTGMVFSLTAAVAIVRECEQIEAAMGIKRGTHSAAMWAGLLDKPNIVALIKDVKGVNLDDGKIFVVKQFGANGLVIPDNVVSVSPTDAVLKGARAP